MNVYRDCLPPAGAGAVAKTYVATGPAMRAALLRFGAHQCAPRHAHTESEELFFVIGGSCVLHAGADAEQLTAGDVALLAPGEPHTFAVGDEELVLLAVVAPNRDDAKVYP